MRVLLAEDEKKVSHFISKALCEAGYEVEEVHDGNRALERALSEPYDVLILDIMMPGRDGLSVLKELRAQRISSPVLILTARGEVSERVEGLEMGADDYMAKPFALRELIARVGAMTRRNAPEQSTLLKVGDLCMNVLNREVSRAGKPIHLAVREFALLEFFLRNPGRVHTRTSLCERVWNYHFDTGTNIIDVYVKRLREKVDDGHAIRLLQTVRGVGYLLQPPQ